MATNLKLDDNLVQEALQVSGLRTKREAVNAALQEYVSRHRKMEFLKHQGTIDFDPEYDYKHERNRH